MHWAYEVSFTPGPGLLSDYEEFAKRWTVHCDVTFRPGHGCLSACEVFMGSLVIFVGQEVYSEDPVMVCFQTTRCSWTASLFLFAKRVTAKYLSDLVLVCFQTTRRS